MKNHFRRRAITYAAHGRSSTASFRPSVWFWRTLIVLYFLACFVIAGARWFIEYRLEDYRDVITAQVSEATGVQIEIGHFDGGFRYIWPVLSVEDVRISRPGDPVSLTLPRVTAVVSWSSLWHLEPRFLRLTVLAPSLNIRRLSPSAIEVAGFVLQLPDTVGITSENSARTNSVDHQLTSWLFAQRKLELIGGTLSYRDEAENRTIRVTDTNIVFEEELLSWRTALEGTVHAEDRRNEAGEQLVIRGEVRKKLFGRPGDPSTWDGRLYAKVSRTNVARILRKLGLRRLMKSGHGAAEAWAHFENGRLTELTADVALRNVDMLLGRELAPLRLQWLTSRIRYDAQFKDSVDRSLTITGLDFLTTNGERLGTTDLFALLQTDPSGQYCAGRFQASRIDIRSLTSLVPRLPLPDPVRKFVTDHRPSGLLTDVAVSFSGDPADSSNWEAGFLFDRLSLPASKDGLPGFERLTGRVEPLKNSGGFAVTLDARDAKLSFPGIFRRPDMTFDTLKAETEITFHPTPAFRVKSLHAANAEAEASGSGTWLATGGAGTLDISGKLLRARADAVHHYIPRVCGEGVLNWLEAAIRGGSGNNGTFVVRGPLNTFPWDDAHKEEGLFKIEADVTGGRLDFLPSHKLLKNGSWETEAQWPMLTDINAHLRFEGNGMWITGQSAKSLGLRASNVSVSIPSYTNKAALLIDGTIDGDLSDALRYLNKSVMLRRILADAFRESTGKGDTRVNLDLNMPFSDPSKIKVGLKADLKNADFYYGLHLPSIQNTNGTLFITEKSVTTQSPITGMTANGPVTVDASTENSRISLKINGHVSPAEAQKLLALPGTAPFFERLRGTAPVRVETVIGLDKPYLGISGSTTLQGITSALPPPYVKAPDDIWQTNFSWLPRENGSEVIVRAPRRAELALRFTETNGRTALTSGFIGLLNEPLQPVSQGLAVSLDTPELNFSEWRPLIEASLDDVNRADANTKTTSEGIPAQELISVVRSRIGALHWDGKTFDDVDATLRRFNRSDWHLRIASTEARGQIEYLRETPTHPDSLTVKLTRLHLPNSVATDLDQAVTTTSSSAVPAPLPDISIVIDDLAVGDRQIGKVELTARNRLESVRRIWDIPNLTIRNAGGTLTGRGSWGRDPGSAGETALSLSATVTDMGKVLESLAYPDAMTGAPGRIHAELGWLGAPYSPDIGSLSGSVSSELGSGSLLQIEPGAGRLLSLLSLQHLMRRITLDFRDVLSRGFRFDSINFSGRIHKGVYSTPKSIILGSSATVVIGGNVDLGRETLDLKTVILPAINVGGPSLALAIINPAVGIGTFLTQWLFKDQLSNAFRMEYDVKGTFDNPEVIRKERIPTITEFGSPAG